MSVWCEWCVYGVCVCVVCGVVWCVCECVSDCVLCVCGVCVCGGVCE